MVVYPAIFHKSKEGGYVVVFSRFWLRSNWGKNIGAGNGNGKKTKSKLLSNTPKRSETGVGNRILVQNHSH